MGRANFWLTFVFFNGVMFPMHILGMRGMPRRIFDHARWQSFADLQGLNVFMTICVLILGSAQLIFIVNFFYSMVRGRTAAANPWNANTLEWTVDRPGHGKFPVIPTVYRGPCEYSVPGMQTDFLPPSLAVRDEIAVDDGPTPLPA